MDDAPWVSSEDEDDLLEQKRAAKAEADRRSKTEALMAQMYNQSSSSSKRPKSMQIQPKQPNKDARARRPKSMIVDRKPGRSLPKAYRKSSKADRKSVRKIVKVPAVGVRFQVGLHTCMQAFKVAANVFCATSRTRAHTQNTHQCAYAYMYARKLLSS